MAVPRGIVFLFLAAACSFSSACRKSAEVEPKPAEQAKTPEEDNAASKAKTLQLDASEVRTSNVTDKELAQLKEMPNLRHLILDDAPVTDEGMKEVGALGRLQSLFLTHTGVTDAGLASLKGMTALRELRLDRLRITDAGLEHIKALPNLRKLSLWHTHITDAGLAHVKALSLLEHLSLDETRVSDEGLKELHGLASLKYLSVWKTKVSDGGVDALKKSLPKVKVNR